MAALAETGLALEVFAGCSSCALDSVELREGAFLTAVAAQPLCGTATNGVSVEGILRSGVSTRRAHESADALAEALRLVPARTLRQRAIARQESKAVGIEHGAEAEAAAFAAAVAADREPDSYPRDALLKELLQWFKGPQ